MRFSIRSGAVKRRHEYPQPPKNAPPKIPGGVGAGGRERIEPPPLAPKTPIHGQIERQGTMPPYPVDDAPPPRVDMARAPDYKGR